jgi:hypothetical protein
MFSAHINCKVPLLLIGYESNKIEINIKLHNEADNSYKVRFEDFYLASTVLPCETMRVY